MLDASACVAPSALGGAGAFARSILEPGDFAFAEEPGVRIRDADAIDMQVYAEVMDEEAPSRYASIYQLLELEGGWPKLEGFVQGDRGHFRPELLAEIDVAAAEVAAAEGSVSEAECRRRLLTFQSNAWRGDGFMALYPSVCRINHSCRPNVRVDRGAARAEVVALRTIQRGEELTADYVGEELLARSVEERRRALADTWGFLCMCDRCQAEAAGAS